MGHSDGFGLQQATDSGTRSSKPAVAVWGDMSKLPATIEAPMESGSNQERTNGADATAAEVPGGGDIYHRIGQLTRTLHDALRELGYHETLADARSNLPDARDRLAYIARLTGDAAERVLNSVDRARSVQDEMSGRAQGLQTRWAAVAAYTAKGERATPAGEALVADTCAFLDALGKQATQTNEILTEIMMAQDFHDLTGQVIRKVVELAQTLEDQLLKLLIEAHPVETRKSAESGKLEGPVVNAEGRSDVVTDQAGVDDLLASLGF